MRKLSPAARQKIAVLLKEKSNANPFKQPAPVAPPAMTSLAPKLSSSSLLPAVQSPITSFPTIRSKFAEGGMVHNYANGGLSKPWTDEEKAAFVAGATGQKLPTTKVDNYDSKPIPLPLDDRVSDAATAGEELTREAPPIIKLPNAHSYLDDEERMHLDEPYQPKADGGTIVDPKSPYLDPDAAKKVSKGASESGVKSLKEYWSNLKNGLTASDDDQPQNKYDGGEILAKDDSQTVGSIIGYPGSPKPIKKASGGQIQAQEDEAVANSDDPQADRASQGFGSILKSLIDSGPQTQDSISPDYNNPVDMIAGGVGGKLGGMFANGASNVGKQQLMNEVIDPAQLMSFLSQKPSDANSLKHYSGGKVFNKEGYVPGKAKVKGDSIKNDVVPALLSPGEFVIDKEHVQNPKRAFKFLQDKLKKKA